MDERRLPIYVINMDKSKDRLREMRRRCAKAGCSFIRVAAIDGTKVLNDTFCRLTNPGQKGCLLSHVKAARRILRSGSKFAVVLEDDATFKRAFPQTIKDVKRLLRELKLKTKQVDILYLQGMRRGRRGEVVGGFGTYGMLLTRSGARKIVKVARNSGVPVDWAIKNHTRTDRDRCKWGSVTVPGLNIRSYCGWKERRDCLIGHKSISGSTINRAGKRSA